MKHTSLFISAAVFLIAVAACGPGKPEPEPVVELTPEQSEEIRQSLVSWFECEECEQSEMEAVVKHGSAAVPSLVATLRAGSSPASRELLRRALDRRYTELKEYELTHPDAKVAGTRDEFIDRYMSNFDAQYRVRAATALAAIGGDTAEAALREALDAAPRDDVRAAVAGALEKSGR